MTTFTDLLADLVRREPGRPLVTFYDDATGERVELSRTTYANWVAKVSGLLVDELDLERGMSLRVDLPPHWLGPVVLGAAWTVGLVVTDAAADADRPDAVICGPAALAAWAPRSDHVVVVAAALLPMGVRFPDPVPSGVHDLGVEVWSQPDGFTALDPPSADDPAVDLGGDRRTQGELWDDGTDTVVADGGRLLSEANPASPPGLASWVEPLRRGGSLVLVASADPERLEATAAAERVTDRFPAGDPPARPGQPARS